ncbi:MAG: hypothetical protein H0X30_25940 [Anaerolineae bacterium]|nr:hypothetical protein [Anaerolineae bacterium]
MRWLIDQEDHSNLGAGLTLTGRVKLTSDVRDLSFYVGVCKDCEKELKQEGVILWAVRGIGCTPMFLGALGFAAAIKGTAPAGVPYLVYVVAMAGGLIFLLAGMLLVVKKDLGKRSRDGKKFTFRNKKYEAAFAKLNPNLVKRKYSEPAA